MALMKTFTEIDRVLQANTGAMAAIVSAQDAGSIFCYGRQRELTLVQAQERVNQFGTDAVRLFRLSAMLAYVRYLVTGSVPNIMPAGWGYTENADGTVTLNDTGVVTKLMDEQFASLPR
jgi:hypothetical protein